jgi:hypothetical protein
MILFKEYDVKYYLCVESSSLCRFHICGETKNHINGYYLFSLAYGGLNLEKSVNKSGPLLFDINIDNENRLRIIGVDEI